jgi:hypothetical protein
MKPCGPPRRALYFRNCHLTNLITLVIITEIDAKQNLKTHFIIIGMGYVFVTGIHSSIQSNLSKQ